MAAHPPQHKYRIKGGKKDQKLFRNIYNPNPMFEIGTEFTGNESEYQQWKLNGIN